MEKKELKLKKETLSNLTNLNIKEMEEIKGGLAAPMQDLDASLSVTLATVTVSVTATVSVTWSKSWSW